MGVKVVIMAGGSGERFWPLSREDKPKQFLNLFGDTTLIQETVRRASLISPSEHTYILTGKAHRGLVQEQVSQVPRANIVFEPAVRDTAPCIALAAAVINASDPDATMVVMPSDHLILGDEGFVATVNQAVRVANTTGGLVTIGINPTRPETGYGYLLMGEEVEGMTPVEGFVEKPDLDTARRLVAEGRHLWNSGIFVWKVQTIRYAIEKHLPELAKGMRAIEESIPGGGFEIALEKHFPGLPRVSIDYGVMEKASSVWVVPAAFEWDDLGCWLALERVKSADSDGNRIAGNVLATATRQSIVSATATGRLVATLGIEGALVVDTPDAVLVASKESAGDLKEVFSRLRDKAFERFACMPDKQNATLNLDDLSGCCRVVEKPWGKEIWWGVTHLYAGKILQVRAGHSLSLQYHRKKHETMLFISGEGHIELGGSKTRIKPPMVFEVPPGTVHRISASTDLVFVEVSTPEMDDVVRLEDIYGRANDNSTR